MEDRRSGTSSLFPREERWDPEYPRARPSRPSGSSTLKRGATALAVAAGLALCACPGDRRPPEPVTRPETTTPDAGPAPTEGRHDERPGRIDPLRPALPQTDAAPSPLPTEAAGP